MASRTIPFAPSDALKRLVAKPREALFDLTIDVVTPMFGGGAMPHAADPDWPIRGSAIRGQLRFWWRACNAHKHATAADLFDAEEAIWGSSALKGNPASGPSAIDVEVEIDPAHRGDPVNPDTLNSLSYALFPFRSQANEPAKIGLSDIRRFRLRLLAASHVETAALPDLARAAEAALWAWIAFGGVGSRTRRGCGSLWCADARFHPPDLQGVVQWAKNNAAIHVQGARVASTLRVPELNGARFSMRSPALAPQKAWTDAIEVMKQLRAQKDINGRSTWPDGKSVLELSKATPNTAVPLIPYFPRAEFGLPIGFHFPHLGKSANRVLQPAKAANSSRMASPFVLKPLMISEHRGVAIMLLLNAPMLAGLGAKLPLELQGGNAPVLVTNPDWIGDGVKTKQVTALTSNGATNARDALINFAHGDGWTTAVTL